MFKELHLHLRYSTPYSSPKLAIELMSVLVLLMERTLQPTRYHRHVQPYHEQGNDDYEETHGSNGLKESTQKLLLAVSKLKTASTVTSSGHDGSNKSENQSTRTSEFDYEYTMFIKNVKRRIPFPLTILCKLLPIHSSSKVRMAGVQLLCKCILVDTVEIWGQCDNCDDGDRNSVGDAPCDIFKSNLQETAFEHLMIMMGDESVEGEIL